MPILRATSGNELVPEPIDGEAQVAKTRHTVDGVAADLALWQDGSDDPYSQYSAEYYAPRR